MKHKQNETDKLLLKAGEGRIYNCGTMTAVLKQTKMRQQTNTAFLNGGLNLTLTDLVLINTKTMTKYFTA